MRKHLLVIALASAAGSAGAQNILANGSFEDGLNGWTASGLAYAVNFEVSRDFLAPTDPDWGPLDGDFFASLWSTDSAGVDSSSLSISFGAGAGFELSFWYFFDFGDFTDAPDALTISLTGPGGQTMLAEHNTASGGFLADDENIGWSFVEHVFADAGDYTLSFAVTDANGSFESILGVDAVQVVPSPAVVGVAGIVLLRRRRRV